MGTSGMDMTMSELEDRTYMTNLTDSIGRGFARRGSGHRRNENASEVRALVKHETRAVLLLKGVVLAVLVCAAAVSAKMVYDAFMSKSYDAYAEEYEAVATRLVELYRQDVLQKLWLAHSLAAEITTLMTINGWNSSQTTIPDLDSLTAAAVALGPVKTVRWSPMLDTKEDLVSFQAYVSSTQQQHISEGENDVEHMNQTVYEPAQLPSSPLWQVAPKPLSTEEEEEEDQNGSQLIIEDMMSNPIFKESLVAMRKVKGPVMSQTYILSEDSSNMESEDTTAIDVDSEDNDGSRQLESSDESADEAGEPAGDGSERASTLFFPIFSTETKEKIVGSVSLEFVWSNYLSGYALIDDDLVREENVFDTDEVDVVIENTCGQIYTIKVNHGAFVLIAEGDVHNQDLDDLVLATTYEEFDAKFASFGSTDFEGNLLSGHCRYRFLAYPTQDIWNEHHTNEPTIYALVVALIFLFTSSIFLLYDFVVTRRQRIITQRAMETNAIVSALFPENVRKRMYQNAKDAAVTATPKRKLTSFLDKNENEYSALTADAPIADLFPNCTVLFADIAGFTAWSSEREPSQIFKLLERTFGDFDRTARKLGVFKVETIGDCYMAVTGLPNPRDDHAVVMARFARIITFQMQHLGKDLENSLGPSTGDLKIRVGLHSGPCTAGVLRGEKSRFQLFGDTVNTASRLETTGVAGKIHISSTSAEELRRLGFESWLIPRTDTPPMKGKGQMQTYFVATQETPSSDQVSNSCASDVQDPSECDNVVIGKPLPMKLQRLVNWNVELLDQYLKKVLARRQAISHQSHLSSSTSSPSAAPATRGGGSDDPGNRQAQVMDDMVDVLTLPRFDEKVAKRLATAASDNDNGPGPSLSEEVRSELHDFVTCIASRYNDVPFHNFQHASHVALSSMKLLNRIVTPEDVQALEAQESISASGEKSGAFFTGLKGKKGPKSSKEKEMINFYRAVHEATYGISSDPLLQFAVVFSALIHDVDHQGVPNLQLIKEDSPLASRFHHKSVAEQNSVDIAFSFLRNSRYDNLRKCIAPNDEEWARFRQLVVVAVLSTDIASAELRKQRADKWDKAFVAVALKDSTSSSTDSDCLLEETVSTTDSSRSSVRLSDRRATAVLEQVIQASDVAHTMQHWHTYVKWNQRLFEETYRNYIRGRAEKDPVHGWYEGEMGFFDHYIIPLAKKLDTCGVFGVSKDEYLIFASENRKEWEVKGRDLVEEVHKKCQEKYGATQKIPTRLQIISEDDVDGFVESVDC